MKSGKLSSENLKEMIIDQIESVNDDILIRPGVGEDCAAIDFGEYACVLSTDPITAAASEIGKLAVHINCNDIASAGVKPMALMLTILVPPGTSEETLAFIMKQASEEARSIGVDIIGGHTEITSAVNRPLISATAIGKQVKEKVVATRGASAGDKLVMTKNVGLEGTGILAYDKEAVLKSILTSAELAKAKAMLDNLSVIPEGIIAGEVGVTAMHDVTEGGILGAAWEMCDASELGCLLEDAHLPVEAVTLKICEYFEIDPLKLISSGCMLMTVASDKVEVLLSELEKAGIPAAVIGEMTKERQVLLNKDAQHLPVLSPEADELYKVID